MTLAFGISARGGLLVGLALLGAALREGGPGRIASPA
jgi:hypothetical protein